MQTLVEIENVVTYFNPSINKSLKNINTLLFKRQKLQQIFRRECSGCNKTNCQGVIWNKIKSINVTAYKGPLNARWYPC